MREFPDYWDPKPLEHGDYWWFTEVGEEADPDEYHQDLEVSSPQHQKEQLEFRIDRFIITVEAGMNDTTLPMILFESSLSGFAENWTEKLSVDAALQFQVSYYNEAFSVWETVVEPVQRQPGKWDRWQLNAKVCYF